MDVSEIFGIVGTITTIAMFSAPANHFRLIVQKGSVGEWSVFPYIIGFVQCLLWLVYDIHVGLVVHACANGAGMILQFIFCIVFIRYAAGRRLRITAWLLTATGISAAICLVTLLTAQDWSFIGGSPDARAGAVLGAVCVAVCISMFAAPLDVTRKVMMRRVAVEECLPWFYSLNIVINLAMWIVYGIMKKDNNVVIPCSIGWILGVIQLVLYRCYQNCPPRTETCDPDEATSPEKAATIVAV
eukprot:TRINITY_DN582_c1_g1_i1.p1 TRINITY_DN582_c1_g1~~TRINITY_DN582_c1_g1_i1.p1  ORF type:complete len:243 (+),score=26.49 TRINITY_DN582_c1_g1_i1:71-799(+)